jgi:hypothetical protein
MRRSLQRKKKSPKTLPPPEWFEEMRQHHLTYGREHAAIRALPLSEERKRYLTFELWWASNQRREALEKLALRGLKCTATKPNGARCSRPARLDYIGQKCSAHAPHINEYPELEETRRLWALHEANRA